MLEVKRTLYDVLEDAGRHRVTARTLRQALIVLILVNIVVTILDTVPDIAAEYGHFIALFQLVSGIVFMLEYVLRLYVADLHPPLRRYGPLWARLRYAVHIDAIVDLIAALPLVLVLFLPNDAVTVLVLLRLLRFLKLARYSPALRSLLAAIASERQALMGSAVIICGVVLMSATLMYIVEHDVQPENFRSILHGIYWAVTTVTTVGYGDVVPQSNLGKAIGGVVMLLGYALLALPVGIIASAFSREIHSRDFVVTWSMVARVPLFEDLTAAEIAEVSKLLKAQKAKSGTLIAAKGSVAEQMYFISQGEVEIAFESQTIHLDDGHFFGELALIHQRPRTADVRAKRDCELLVLEAEALRHLMRRNSRLTTKILKEAEKRIGENLKSFGDLASEELVEAEIIEVEELLESEPELFKDVRPEELDKA